VVLDAPGREPLRPAFLRDLLRALRALREAAPALAVWASTLRVPVGPRAARARAAAPKLD
jgi:hypothetical protein